MIKKHISHIDVYTDGSFSKQNKIKLCGYGIYFPNGEFPNVSNNFTIKPLTNQRAELFSIYSAIKIIDDNCTFDSIMIYSDSEYSIKSISVWIDGWKKNGWVTKGKKPVLNQDIILSIDKYLDSPQYKNKIKFTHVKAHTKNNDVHSINNDIADKLAKAGSKI